MREQRHNENRFEMAQTFPHLSEAAAASSLMKRGSLRAVYRANWPAVRLILPAWYCHLEEFFLIEKFTLKQLLPACEKQLPFGAENVKETPAYMYI